MSSTKIITKDNGMEEFKSVQAVNVLKRITVELTDVVYKDEFLERYAKNIPKEKHDQFWAEYLLSMDAVIVRSMWGTIPHAVCDIELEEEVRSRADEDEDTLDEELCENMEVLVDRFAEENEDQKWWEVSVDLDGKEYGNFLVFAATEEAARDEIADNEPQDYPIKYNQMNLSAHEYTGKTDHLDTSMYHKLDD